MPSVLTEVFATDPVAIANALMGMRAKVAKELLALMTAPAMELVNILKI